MACLQAKRICMRLTVAVAACAWLPPAMAAAMRAGANSVRSHEVRTTTAQGAGCSIDRGIFLRMKSYMTYREVVNAVGCEGQRVMPTIPGDETVFYEWSGKGSAGAKVKATFEYGVLVEKSQVGLN